MLQDDKNNYIASILYHGEKSGRMLCRRLHRRRLTPPVLTGEELGAGDHLRTVPLFSQRGAVQRSYSGLQGSNGVYQAAACLQRWSCWMKRLSRPTPAWKRCAPSLGMPRKKRPALRRKVRRSRPWPRCWDILEDTQKKGVERLKDRTRLRRSAVYAAFARHARQPGADGDDARAREKRHAAVGAG